MISERMIKVSVVIPVYNVENYLSECLDSVLGQTLRDIEIICVEDASTDKSIEILERYEKVDDRIKVYSNHRNLGLAATRDRGFNLAAGKYIYALDSDDKITEDALQMLYDLAEENDSDVVTFEGELLFQTEEMKRRFARYLIVRKYEYPLNSTGKDLFCMLMKSGEWVCSIPRHFYRRKFLEENNLRFTHGLLDEDDWFSFQVYMKAGTVTYSRERLFIRRFRENSIRVVHDNKKYMLGVFEVMIYLLKFRMSEECDKSCALYVDKYIYTRYEGLRNTYYRLDENIRDTIRFRTEEMNTLYHLFCLVMRKNQYVLDSNGYDIEKIAQLSNQEIVIFGAGVKTKEIWPILMEHNVRIRGIAVSNAEENKDALYGCPVHELSYFENDLLQPVLICLSEKKEVEKLLRSRGFSNIIDIKGKEGNYAGN